MTVIRKLRIAYEEYRVVQKENSSIEIQKLNDDTEIWEPILWFDTLATACDPSGFVGDFSKIDGLWVFVWKDGSQTECEPHDEDFDGLIDSQIQIFKQWLVK